MTWCKPAHACQEVVIWISAEDGFSAWLPSEVLTYLNPDGEEQPYEFYQQALMRLNKGALLSKIWAESTSPSQKIHLQHVHAGFPAVQLMSR